MRDRVHGQKQFIEMELTVKMPIFPNIFLVTILTELILLMWSSQCVAKDCKSNGLGVDIYYIRPDSTANSSCPAFPCETLDHYANVSRDFENNSCLFFLPGLHRLSKTFALRDLHLIQFIGGYSGNYSFLRIGTSSYQYSRPQVFCNKTNPSAGFTFQNINYLSIQNLEIVYCGQIAVHKASLHVQTAVTLKQIFALSMSSVIIRNSSGYGLVAEGVYGNSNVSDCNFIHNSGNVAILYTNCPSEYTASRNNLNVFGSNFMHGSTSVSNCDICYNSKVRASGLVVHMSCTNVYMHLFNTAFGFNEAYGNSSKGGNLHITFHNESYHINNSIVVENSTIMNGKAVIGGGVYIKYSLTPSKTNESFPCENNVLFKNTNFIENSGSDRAGAIFVTFVEGDMVDECPVGHVSIENCYFGDNILSTLSADAGVAIGVFTLLKNGVLSTSPPYLTLHIKDSQFVNNTLRSGNQQSSLSGGAIVYIGNRRREIFITDSTFESNQGTAISVFRSNIVFQGNITIRNNIGIDGGGLIICEGSYILLSQDTNLIFEHNAALHFGGAIYVADQYLEVQHKYSCVFQIYEEQTPFNPVLGRGLRVGEITAASSGLQMDIYSLLDTIHIKMVNNTAKNAGSQIYGGSMDYCMVIVNQKKFSGSFYDKVFDESQWKYNHTDLSYVTSNARYACFCDENSKVMCDLKRISLTINHGKSFLVSVVAVGQFQHPVPATIVANTSTTSRFHQTIHHECTKLKFNVNSANPRDTLALSVMSDDGYVTKEGGPMIFIDLSYKDCLPWLLYDPNTNKCNVTAKLRKLGYSFDPDSSTLSRPGGTYVEIVSSHLSWYNCPSHYCNGNKTEIYLNETYFDSDSQCVNNRSGYLCGRCNPPLSEAISSSRCLPCKSVNKKAHLSLLVLAYVAISIIVVFILVIFNITITDGTLSGLIFYLNIFDINREFFVPNSIHDTLLINVVSVINLDIGSRTCFCDGFDGFGRTILQFFAPVLMWITAGIIIFASSRSNRIAALVGRNAVKMLATLFLLSYSKVLLAMVAVFSCIESNHHFEQQIWLRDGNIKCWQGKHLILVSIGVIFAIFTIMYTIILLFVQPLQRYSHLRALKWFAKLKPFIDAYTSPNVIKDQYRFWTGLLLSFRIACVVIIALWARFNEPERNLGLVITICAVILTLMGVCGGIYETRWLNCLNSFFYLNLVCLAVMTWYTTNFNDGHLQQLVTSISLSITMLAFVLIMIYKVYNVVKTTGAYSICMTRLRQSNSSLLWSCLVLKCQNLRQSRVYQRIPQNENPENGETHGCHKPDQELQVDFDQHV